MYRVVDAENQDVQGTFEQTITKYSTGHVL